MAQINIGSEAVALPSPLFLAKANLQDPSPFCRHLMLLTESSIALRLLFECDLLKQNKTVVLIGSQFPRDANDELRMVRQINEIKRAMQNGHTVVLVNHEGIFPSLYDVLNMRYTTKRNADTGKVTRMLRLAVGNRSQWCSVGDGFKIVVVVEAKDAYEKLDLPLLNRFEKQMLRAEDALFDSKDACDLLEAIKIWVNQFEMEIGFNDPFVGMYSQTLPSLVHYKRLELSSSEKRAIEFPRDMNSVKEVLYSLLSPLARFHALRYVSPSNQTDKNAQDPLLPSGVSSMPENIIESLKSATEKRKRLLVLTFSAIQDLGSVLKYVGATPELNTIINTDVIALSSVTSEREFIQALKTTSDLPNKVKIIQCDPSLVSPETIEHAKYIVAAELRNQPVAFIVHLPPGGRRRRTFNVDFQKGWDVVFIDDLVRSDFSDLVNCTPLQWANQSDNLRRVIGQKLTVALALARPPLKQGGTLIGARERILQIQELLQDPIIDEIVIQRTVRDCLALLPSTAHVDLVARGEARGGTVTDSLVLALETLILRAFAVALRWFDQDMNLVHLAHDSPPHLRRLWYLLCSPPSAEALSASLIDISSATGGFVRNSGRPGLPLVARFPWSCRVCEALDSAMQGKVRGVITTSEGFNELETMLEGVLHTAFGKEVYEMTCCGQIEVVKAYISDLCGFSANRRPELSLEEQTRLVVSWLLNRNPNVLESLSRAHILFRTESWALFALLSIRAALRVLDVEIMKGFSFSRGYLAILSDFLLSTDALESRSWCDCVRTIAEHMLDALVKLEDSQGKDKWNAVLLQLAHVESGASLSPDVLLAKGSSSAFEKTFPVDFDPVTIASINAQAKLYCKIAHDILAKPGSGEMAPLIFPRILSLCATSGIMRPIRLSCMNAVLAHLDDPTLKDITSSITSKPVLFALALELTEDNIRIVGEEIHPPSEVVQTAKYRQHLRCIAQEKFDDLEHLGIILEKPIARAFLLNELFSIHGDLGTVHRVRSSSQFLRLFHAPESVIYEAVKKEMRSKGDGGLSQAEKLPVSIEGTQRKGCFGLIFGPSLLEGAFELINKYLQRDPSRFGGDENTVDSHELAKAIRERKKRFCQETYAEHLKRLQNLRCSPQHRTVLWVRDQPLGPCAMLRNEKFTYTHFVVTLMAAAASHTFLHNQSLLDSGAFDLIEMFLREIPEAKQHSGRDAFQVYRLLVILSCSLAKERYWSEVLPLDYCTEHVRFLILSSCYTAILIDDDSSVHYLGETLRGQGANLSKCSIPGMDDSIIAQVARAIEGVEYVGWWTCSNGHRYAIGECTMPMQMSKCPDCGAKIGGESHTPVRGAMKLDEPSNNIFSPGYYPVEMNEGVEVRQLKTNPLALIQFIFHACVVVNLGTSEGCSRMRVFLGTATGRKAISSTEIIQASQRSLKRSLRLFCATVFPSTFSATTDHYELIFSGFLAHVTRGSFRKALEGDIEKLKLSPHYRLEYELCLTHLAHAMGAGLPCVIQNMNKVTQAIGEAANRTVLSSLVKMEVLSLAESLSSAKSVDDETEIDRIKWRYRVPLTVAEIMHAIEPVKAEYPFLGEFSLAESRLQLVPRLADIFEWVGILNEALALRGKRIARDEAAKLSNEAALETLPPSRQAYAREVLSRFCRAFNETFPLVRFLYECQRNPFLTDDNKVDLSGRRGAGNQREEMTFNTPVSFSLSAIIQGDADAPSLCIFQLVRTLQQLNNAILGELGTARFIRAYERRNRQNAVQLNVPGPDQAMAYDEQDLPETTMQTPREIIVSRLISYDRDRDLISTLSCSCMRSFFALDNGGSDMRHIDFDIFSEILRTKIIGSRLPIRVVVPSFEYAREARRSGGLAGLKARIPQAALSRTVSSAIANELDSDSRIQPLMELIDAAVSFLAGATGFDGETPLGTFLVNVLGVSEGTWDEVASQPIKQNVRLAHLGALYALLEEAKNGTPLDSVHTMYRRPLGGEREGMLRSGASKLDLEMLLPILHDLLVIRLIESVFPEDAKLAEFLEYSTDVELSSLPWFVEHFPGDLVLGYAYHTYMVLSEYI